MIYIVVLSINYRTGTGTGTGAGTGVPVRKRGDPLPRAGPKRKPLRRHPVRLQSETRGSEFLSCSWHRRRRRINKSQSIGWLRGLHRHPSRRIHNPFRQPHRQNRYPVHASGIAVTRGISYHMGFYVKGYKQYNYNRWLVLLYWDRILKPHKLFWPGHAPRRCQRARPPGVARPVLRPCSAVHGTPHSLDCGCQVCHAYARPRHDTMVHAVPRLPTDGAFVCSSQFKDVVTFTFNVVGIGLV